MNSVYHVHLLLLCPKNQIFVYSKFCHAHILDLKLQENFSITSNILINSFEKLNDNFLKIQNISDKKYFDKEE